MSSENTHNTNDSLWRGTRPDTGELLDSAVLYAMGLLDDEDALAYSDALDAADPEVRRMVIEEQARFAVVDELLPDLEPPPPLRARVVGAVMAEVAKRRPARPAPAAAPVGAASDQGALSGAVRHGGGRRAPTIARPRRVHPAWRAAAIGLCVAVVALGAVQLQLQGEYQTFKSEASVARLIDTIGVAHIRDTLLDPRTQQFIFAVEADATEVALDAQAAVWINPDWNEARLYCYRLPQGATASYRVVQLDEAGNELATLAKFRSGGLLDTVPVPLGEARDMRVAIVMERGDTAVRLLTASISRA